MKNDKHALSRKEKKDLEKQRALLKESPDDAQAASRVGYLLEKAGRREESLEYLWAAFINFVKNGRYSMAIMIADELLSIEVNNLEIMHRLSQMAHDKDLEIPALKFYKKHKKFHTLPLFSELNELEFLQLLKISSLHSLKKNRVLIREGAKGNEIYFLAKGSMKVSRKAKGKKDIILGALEEGDFMGEIAYMSDKKRSATISANTDCQLLSWRADDIRDLSQNHPPVYNVLHNTFWDRSIDTIITLSPLFKHLDGAKRKKIKDEFRMATHEPGDIILQEGMENLEKSLYIIKKGEAAVFTEKIGSRKKPMAILRVGDIFGEYSAISGKPCTATVMARTPLQLLTSGKSALVEIIRDDPELLQKLEGLKTERFGDTLQHMSYFQYIQDLPAPTDGT